MASLEGKLIAISGAASGIGKATAFLLASRGANLALADNRQDALDEAVKEIQKEHPSIKIVSSAVNVTKSDEVVAWLDEVVKQLGKLDGAANLAGITGTQGVKPITQLDDQEWDLVLDVNLRGTFNCLRAELGRMNDNGSIINASSVAGLRGSAAFAPYVTSKHAVIGLTRTAAKEACKMGIKVNAIAPGAIDTPMVRKMDADLASIGQPGFIDKYIPTIPMARVAQPIEVAKLIAFLLSDENTYITGSVYPIDGGIMC